MAGWTNEELKKIEKADELQLESSRSDGSLRAPVTIWVVRVGEDIYVRAVKGRSGPWFRGTLTRHTGRIRCGGVEKEVLFVDEEGTAPNEEIDTAYRAKYGYGRYPKEYVDSCLTPEARAATIQMVPC